MIICGAMSSIVYVAYNTAWLHLDCGRPAVANGIERNEKKWKVKKNIFLRTWVNPMGALRQAHGCSVFSMGVLWIRWKK